MKSTRHIRIDVRIDEVADEGAYPPEHAAERTIIDEAPQAGAPLPVDERRHPGTGPMSPDEKRDRRQANLNPKELRKRGWPDDRTYGSRIIAGERPVRPEERINKSGFLSLLQSLAVTVVMAVFAVTFLVQAFQVPSSSMETTLLAGDHLLVDKLRFGSDGGWGRWLPYEPVKRGDIVVFKWPVSPAQYFVKRVVGIPGDRIRVVNKRLLVNDVPPREKFVVHQRPYPDPFADNFPGETTGRWAQDMDHHWAHDMRLHVHDGELIVPADQYFVLGDNRDNSLDSRYWGFVPRENIIGRPLTIYWSASVADPFLEHWRNRDAPNDKISQWKNSVESFFQNARWERSFRPVR